MLSTEKQNQYIKVMTNPISYKLGLSYTLPMASIAGMKLKTLNQTTCEVTVPFKFLNKNPFGSTYWAVLGMASEAASGILLMMYVHKLEPSVSTFVTGCNAKFIKQAKGITTFVCNDGKTIAESVLKSITTGDAQTFHTTVNGYDKDGTLLCEFEYDWGVKQRRK
ncbi:MAG: DUF4442 domain-containing protein [Chitinophagales bacterium]|nr:DUF4442 domain-containing protein [Chitinophagales bacterium]